MSAATEFDIDSEVECTDGSVGHLRRVVLDPVARAMTHIVVEPRSRRDVGHLVPIKYVASAGEKVKLTVTKAQFEAFEVADETDFVRLTGDWGGYDAEQVLSWPYYGLHASGAGVLPESGIDQAGPAPTELIKDHYIPLGEVEVGRGDQVHATDGPIGHVHGLVIDPENHHVTHFLLEEGHFWGRKTVCIPIGAVNHVADDDVRVNLTKDQIRDLPPVDLDRPA
jgi:uncharacterized protein YrrD